MIQNPYREGEDIRKQIELRKTPKELKDERLLKELADANRITPKGKVPPPQPGGAQSGQSSGGAQGQTQSQTQSQDQRTQVIEELVRELSSLEDQLDRRKKLENQTNINGERLLGYNQGFTWRPKCKYVSNISKTSELRHRGGLKGCQRRSCEAC
jgi:hypothetical protein